MNAIAIMNVTTMLIAIIPKAHIDVYADKVMKEMASTVQVITYLLIKNTLV